MKFMLFVVMMLVAVTGVNAADLDVQLRYLYQDAPEGSWLLQNDGAGVYIKEWHLQSAQPSRAQLTAIDAEADAWWASKEDERKAGQIESLEQLVKILTRELNEIRTQVGLPEKTIDQIITGD